mgnify:CR=1 FL=1
MGAYKHPLEAIKTRIFIESTRLRGLRGRDPATVQPGLVGSAHAADNALCVPVRTLAMHWVEAMTESKPQGSATAERRQTPIEPGIRRLLVILVIAVAIGAIMTIVGELVLNEPPIKNAGFTMVLTGGGFYFFVRFLGRMRARQTRDQIQRRKELQGEQDGGGG